MADETTTPETPAAEETASTPTPTGDANRVKASEATPPEPRATHEDVGSGYTKADVERIVQARLQADRDDAAKKAEAAKKKAIDAALKEQGDWQKLADARLAEAEEASRKVAEIEPRLAEREAERDRYRAAVEAHLASQRKGLPKHVLDILDELDAVRQLEMIAKHGDAYKAPAAEPPPTPRGSTPIRGAITTKAGESAPQLPRPREPLARI